MDPKQPHFSVASFLPSLKSLESSVQTMVDAAGGDQAVLQDALSLLQKAMGGQSVPLSVIEEIFSLVAKATQAQAKPTT